MSNLQVAGVFDAISSVNRPAHAGAARCFTDAGQGFITRLGTYFPGYYVGGWTGEKRVIDEDRFVEGLHLLPADVRAYCINIEAWGYSLEWTSELVTRHTTRRLFNLASLVREHRPDLAVLMYQSLWTYERVGGNDVTLRQANKRLTLNITPDGKTDYHAGLLDALSVGSPELYLQAGQTPDDDAARAKIGVTEAKAALDGSKPVVPYFNPYRSGLLDFAGATASLKAMKKARADGVVVWEYIGDRELSAGEAEVIRIAIDLFGPGVVQ